jgi:hypothetical protein
MSSHNRYAGPYRLLTLLQGLLAIALFLAAIFGIGMIVFHYVMKFVAWDLDDPDLFTRYAPDGWSFVKFYAGLIVLFLITHKVTKKLDEQGTLYRKAEFDERLSHDPGEIRRRAAHLEFTRRLVFGEKAVTSSTDTSTEKDDK